jgi:hypothetical protein
VTAVIGLADVGTKSTRLDAQVYYHKSEKRYPEERSFKYMAENFLSYIMKFKPQRFLNKVGEEIECLEESYMLR